MTTAASGFDSDFAGPADWAVMYRACGLQVVPAKAPRSGAEWKMPALAKWAHLQENLIPQDTFDRWYAAGGEFAARSNMGVITGHCSGNLLVLDLDEHKHAAAREWWLATLEAENNRIEPETVQQRTGGGGRQLLFHAPASWRVPTNRTPLGVDVRGQGGFAILPPSLHESGRSYAWLPGCAPWETAIADAPAWLMDAIDALVAEHGGDKGVGSHEKTVSGAAFDAFGNKIDLREVEMRDVVWHAVLQCYRAAPIKPGEREQRQCAAEAYLVYERKVQSRLEGGDKTDLLEREGRGPAAFWRKWQATMRRWGSSKMAEEAAKPPPEAPSSRIAENLAPPPRSGEDAGLRPITLQSAFPIKEADIPRRDWIVPGLFLRRYLSVLVAPPGSGKSLLTLQIAIAAAICMAWGGWTPRKATKVLVINGEDDIDEMRRRLFAAAHVMKVEQEALAGQVLLADAPESIVIAKTDARSKMVVRTPLLEVLVQTIIENGIGIVIVDPFAETFEGDENSNSEIKWAGILWREVARRTGASVLLVHHTRKYAGAMAGDADASRGGGALIGTARILSTLFAMTEEEAVVMNIEPEDRTRYVRFDDAKANQSLISGKARWFEKQTVTLANGTPFIPGDDVGVLMPWNPPGLLGGVSMVTIGQILDTLDRGLTDEQGQHTGQYYTTSTSSPERWAGTVITRLLGSDDERATRILKEWLKNEVVETFNYNDPTIRKSRVGLRSVLNNRPDRLPA